MNRITLSIFLSLLLGIGYGQKAENELSAGGGLSFTYHDWQTSTIASYKPYRPSNNASSRDQIELGLEGGVRYVLGGFALISASFSAGYTPIDFEWNYSALVDYEATPDPQYYDNTYAYTSIKYSGSSILGNARIDFGLDVLNKSEKLDFYATISLDNHFWLTHYINESSGSKYYVRRYNTPSSGGEVEETSEPEAVPADDFINDNGTFMNLGAGFLFNLAIHDDLDFYVASTIYFKGARMLQTSYAENGMAVRVNSGIYYRFGQSTDK